MSTPLTVLEARALLERLTPGNPAGISAELAAAAAAVVADDLHRWSLQRERARLRRVLGAW